jgi:hypothetical protein
LKIITRDPLFLQRLMFVVIKCMCKAGHVRVGVMHEQMPFERAVLAPWSPIRTIFDQAIYLSKRTIYDQVVKRFTIPRFLDLA